MKLQIILLTVIALKTYVDATWYNFRLLRNPGLVDDIASCHVDCVSKCTSTPGCSAASWQQSTGRCLKSMCNSLDLNWNNGWNTYVVDSSYVETLAFPEPHLEWMLTDRCGNNNLSPVTGPKMNLVGTSTFNSSFTLNAGATVQYMGNNGSYARSDTNSSVNNPLGATSQTVMYWLYFNTPATFATGLEYSVQLTKRALLYWVAYGGLWYDWGTGFGTTCSSNCVGTSYSWTPTANQWHHIAFVYDANDGYEKTYLNMSLVGISKTGRFTNNIIWDTVSLAFSVFDKRGPMLGSGFCYKTFKAALTQDQIRNAANSCVTSRIRFTND